MKKIDGATSQTELEHEVLKFWEEKEIFKKLKEQNKNGERFRFLDGPITANNKMGAHHCWGRALKDVYHRFNAMLGKSAHYQNGFDAQGMWVEVNVEKELGLNGKPQIEEYGIANFTEKCMERVKYFAGVQTEQSKRIGQWMDWENSYFTNSDDNILSIWNFLKKCDEKGMIVTKNRPMAWCPRCGTSLSEHEMAGSYKDVVHTAVFFKLPILNSNDSILVWTTTPWTLSANVAIAINPKNNYVRVKIKSDDRTLILGREALKVLKNDVVEVVDEFLGEELVGLSYETCFPDFKMQNFEHKIIPWVDVDAQEGSGAVHIAPGCGAEDFELGKSFDLPEICPINDAGELLPEYGFLAGRKTTDVVEDVVDHLKAQNKLYLAHKYKHSYPYCWRCKTDLVYKLIKTWYIKTEDIKDGLIESIQTVEFQPEYAKKRMEDWLRNMGDWNISRSRYYGLPLPFYVCAKCGKLHVLGSLDELKTLAINKGDIAKIPHLHRPYIDEIKIKCTKCGATVERTPEVGDCWLDAGIVPFSTKKFGVDNKFFEENFPSEFVIEMIEQIKLWFYSLLVMSYVLTGRAPYEKLCTYQYVLDDFGNEFHKSGGNSLDAEIVADKMGADFLRYLYAGASVTNDLRFGYAAGEEAKRKYLGFYNAVVFFNTYAVLDKPKLENFALNTKSLNKSDAYLLSKLNSFVKVCDDAYRNYKSSIVVKEFENLTDELTNWYIRINRKRFWKSEDESDKLNAYYCLYTTLKTIIQVMAPIIPFGTEFLWQNVVREIEPKSELSVHLTKFPQVCENLINSKLETETAVVQNFIAMGQKLRNESQVKIKQPLKTIYFCIENGFIDAIKEQLDTILDELNIKEAVFETDASKFNTSRLVLNFKIAGQVLKGDVQKVKMALEGLNNEEMEKVVAKFKTGNKIDVAEFKNLDNGLFNELFIAKKEFVVFTEQNNTVALDITIDENLMLEGVSRELIRALQVMRKEADFAIEERINIKIETKSELLNKVVTKFENKIKSEVLIKTFGKIDAVVYEKEIEVADEKVEIFMGR